MKSNIDAKTWKLLYNTPADTKVVAGGWDSSIKRFLHVPATKLIVEHILVQVKGVADAEKRRCVNGKWDRTSVFTTWSS